MEVIVCLGFTLTKTRENRTRVLYYKKFDNYQQYVNLQGIKAHIISDRMLADKKKNIERFVRLIEASEDNLINEKVLCLGARDGSEVDAFEKKGFKNSIGIDLHPIGSDVVRGDWHNLPFSNQLFENVFINSVDHCLDLEKLIREIYRVLRNHGILFLVVDQRLNEKRTIFEKINGGKYETLFWDDADDLIRPFEKNGFILFNRDRLGKHVCLFFKKT